MPFSSHDLGRDGSHDFARESRPATPPPWAGGMEERRLSRGSNRSLSYFPLTGIISGLVPLSYEDDVSAILFGIG